MTDLQLDDATLAAAARHLLDAAAAPRASRSLPMLSPETCTGVGPSIASFMRAVTMATESLSDSSGGAAAAVSALLDSSGEVDAEIARVLGAGFVAAEQLRQ